MRCFKCTRPNGRDFHSDTVDYAAALASGQPLTIDAEPANGNVCGRGLHVSPTPRQTIQFANRGIRPWRWFEVEVAESDVVERDREKLRVRALRVVREITVADIFGEDFGRRIEAVKVDAAGWKTIPWLKPTTKVPDAQLKKLFYQWHNAVSPWLRGKATLPKKVRVVRTAAAAAAADAAADAADAADAAADAADAADAAADADADAAAAADADAADTADAAADADAADAARIFFLRYRRWYVRPWHVLRRSARWKLAGFSQDSPWEPLVDMFRLGCLPIGYANGVFVIYAPECKVGGGQAPADPEPPPS